MEFKQLAGLVMMAGSTIAMPFMFVRDAKRFSVAADALRWGRRKLATTTPWASWRRALMEVDLIVVQ